ncbi:MAG: hypothetical protein M9925_07470 [Chloroflexi bacterium]|nr:hypothetical protein [Dehalococcoidia bacterium]MCO5201521.1 hypothetical protein [Chloroflexota bacterium]MCZ7577754.1 hypothetical protein [Dehalococcoidia bacterium]NJD63862.1 hypothetical protein [Chloroflexota bacterium]PWB46472.1 MAG: hypothetical protein C3F10_04505 [Dehalococcoidia bacterium]
MTRLEVRNLRADEIRAQLLREMGGTVDGTRVDGDRWSVDFVVGEPAKVGRMSVPVLFLDVRGEREAEIAHYLRLRTMRGGG